MSPLEIAGFSCMGLLAGFLAGLFGIGGGIVVVPFLLWRFDAWGIARDAATHLAFGTSLLAAAAAGGSGARAHSKRGKVSRREVFPLLAGGVLGTLLGSTLSIHAPGGALRRAFGAVMAVVGTRLCLVPPLPGEALGTEAGKGRRPGLRGLLPELVLVGSAAGVFSGFFGVGGGTIAVPLMTLALGLPVHRAVGNSSAMVAGVSLVGSLIYLVEGWGHLDLPPWSLGYVHGPGCLLIAGWGILGANAGARTAGRMGGRGLARAFGILLVLVGARLGLK